MQDYSTQYWEQLNSMRNEHMTELVQFYQVKLPRQPSLPPFSALGSSRGPFPMEAVPNQPPQRPWRHLKMRQGRESQARQALSASFQYRAVPRLLSQLPWRLAFQALRSCYPWLWEAAAPV